MQRIRRITTKTVTAARRSTGGVVIRRFLLPPDDADVAVSIAAGEASFSFKDKRVLTAAA